LKKEKLVFILFLVGLGSTNPTEHERLLRILFWGSENRGEGKLLTLMKFQKLLYWFGSNGLESLLPTFEDLVQSREYFYGTVSAAQLSQHINKPGQFLIRLNEGGNNPMSVCPFYIARIDQKGKVQLTPVHMSKKNIGHFYCAIPSAEVTEKKVRSKDKPETQISGSHPGIPSLIEAIQLNAKKVLTKSVQYTPFRPEPVSKSLYGVTATEEI